MTALPETFPLPKGRIEILAYQTPEIKIIEKADLLL